MSWRLSQNSRAEDRHVELSQCSGCLEAAEKSGVDQSQVVEEMTTCRLCLHAWSNPTFGRVIVEVVFNMHFDTMQLFVSANLASQIIITPTLRSQFGTYDENLKYM